MTWIDVTDQLPEHNQKVDIWVSKNNLPGYRRVDGSYDGNMKKFKFGGFFLDYTLGEQITHWMPTPEAPK